MTMVVADLASAINNALGPPKDKDGAPIAVTPAMTAYATAVINTLKGGAVAHALVTGTGAPGGSLSAGAAAAGVISGLSTATWLAAIGSAFPGATKLAADAAAACSYLETGLVAFAAGKVTGTCTATPTSPGILSGGAATGGVISGLSGAAWASAAGSPGPLGPAVYGAIASYVMANAVCAYASGTVTGAFSAGGGALAGGVGVGGTIS